MDNPFKILELEERFDLDPAELQQRFLAAASRCHPDRYTDPLQQADAAERMSAVTAAHRALADPESRARALLAIRQGDHPATGDTDAAGDKALPPDLLMEMMEVRESLDEAVAAEDGQAIEKHRAWAEAKRAEHLTTIAGLFEQEAGENNAKAVRLQLNGLRYIERMLEQMPAC